MRMTGFVAAAVREIHDRRTVLVAAAAASVIPILGPILPSLSAWTPGEAAATAAWVIALGFAWLLAALFGMSMAVADFSGDRVVSYYDRPIGGLSIWVGKLIGGYLVVIAVQLVIVVPALVFPVSRAELLYNAAILPIWLIAKLAVILPLVLILAAYTVAVMWRARSVWSLADFAVLLLLAGWLWVVLGPFFEPAEEVFRFGVSLAIVSLIIVLPLGGAVLVASGRVDVRRNRRALSLALWSGFAMVGTSLTGWSLWVKAVEPDDLVKLGGVQATEAGDWVVVSGTARGRFDYEARFLLNTKSGTHFRLDDGDRPGTQFSFVQRWLTWLEPCDDWTSRLVVAALEDDGLTIKRTDIFLDNSCWVTRILISDRGDLVAVRDTHSVSVFDIESGQLLIMGGFKNVGRNFPIWFASDDVVRVVSAPGGVPHGVESAIRISEIDLRSKTVRTVGMIEPVDHIPRKLESWQCPLVPGVRVSPSGDRLLVTQRQGEAWRLTLRDSRAGEVVKEIAFSHWREDFGFLDDGRIFEHLWSPKEQWLVMYSPDCELVSKVLVGNGENLALGGEVAPGVVTTGLFVPGDAWGRRWTAKIVDLNTGIVRSIGCDKEGLDTHPARPAGSANLFFDTEGKLVMLDVESATTRRVLEAKSEIW